MTTTAPIVLEGSKGLPSITTALPISSAASRRALASLTPARVRTRLIAMWKEEFLVIGEEHRRN